MNTANITAALTPLQLDTVARATRHVERDVAEGRSLERIESDVLGRINYPARAEREAAVAIVRAAYRAAH